MAQKVINVADIGPVTFQKLGNTRSLRLHIQGSRVKVTLPTRVPYAFAEKFLLTRKKWVLENLQPTTVILDGAYIGKNYRVTIEYRDTTRPRTRLSGYSIYVILPNGLDSQSSEAQRIIVKACEKALLQETTDVVIPRLQDLAYEHQYPIKSASVKRLRSRWGSCDTHRNIILNSYLVQLPWTLIDYVLVHELAHTKHLNHGEAFWAEVAEVLPNYKDLRRQTKAFSPHVITT